jgi:hypothetical protein
MGIVILCIVLLIPFAIAGFIWWCGKSEYLFFVLLWLIGGIILVAFTIIMYSNNLIK